MSAGEAQSPPVKVRRGLPRTAGEDIPARIERSSSVMTENATDNPAPPTPVADVSPQPPTSASAGAAPRRGLPRNGAAKVAPAAKATAVSAASETVSTEPEGGSTPAGSTLAGSAPAGSAPSSATGPTPPRGGRRSGLARKPTVTTTAPAAATAPTTTAVPAATTARTTAQQPRPAGNAPAPSTAPAAAPAKLDKRALMKSPKVLAVAAGVLLIVLAAAVLAARWLVSQQFMQDFLTTYPGESHLPENAPVGLPAWLGWQHFLNAFFMVLIIRTGWQVRTQKRPPATWTRNNTGLIKTKNPPKKISLTLWAHLSLDALWAINGIVFVVVLFVTGQWMRVVPISWDVFPNALSSAIQYLSLNWPVENGWVNYNSLQLLTYFLTIFVAAPLAAITGFRMSGAWPMKATRLNKLYPIEIARAIHFPVMLYFVLFVIAHVTLVMATGALRNLNHMFAAQDTGSWVGFWIFFASLLVMAGAVFASRPLVWAPIAQLFGKVGR